LLSIADRLLLIAVLVEILAGLLTVMIVGVALIYVFRRTRWTARAYWTTFYGVIGLGLLVVVEDWLGRFELGLVRRALTGPSYHPNGPQGDEIEKLNVIVPFGLLLFFGAPWIRRYLNTKSVNRSIERASL
jgi:hypothetical protein